MVRFRNNAAVFHAEGIVVLASAQLRRGKARAELHALDRRDAEHDLRDAVFHAVEHRRAKPSRKSLDAALDHAAEGIALRLRGKNGLPHLLARIVAHDREGLFSDRRVKRRRVLDAAHADNARHDPDAAGLQKLQADSARDAQRRGQPSGKMPAAGGVLMAAVADVRRIVRVTGTRHALQRRIVLRTDIRIPNDCRQRRAAGDVVYKSAEELRRVGLLPGRRKRPAARRAPGQKAPQRLHIDRKARRKAVHRHADGGRMRLAEDGHGQIFSVAAAHSVSPFKCSQSAQKRG